MKTVSHSRPSIDENEIAAVSAVLRSGQIAQGVQVAAFERALAGLVGVRGGVAVSSGVAALHLSLLALGVQEGDEVVMPAFVCTALLHAVRFVRAVPVFADISRETFTIDYRDVKRRLTKKTRAMIVPHMFGLPADMRELVAFGVPVIEDCAQALGSAYEGKQAGSLGALSVFSFYATKVICTGEGGMVASNDRELLSRIEDLRDYDEKEDTGLHFNCKLTEMQAAMGLVQLKKLPEFIARRREIAGKYEDALQKYQVILPSCPENREHIYFRYPIRTKSARKLIEAGLTGRIAYRRPVFKPLHQHTALHQHTGGYSLPETDAAFEETVSIPLYPALANGEVEQVLQDLTSALEVQRGIIL
jgi:dTDP-4-amino-4,6-dideoxygalactose transaminase